MAKACLGHARNVSITSAQHARKAQDMLEYAQKVQRLALENLMESSRNESRTHHAHKSTPELIWIAPDGITTCLELDLKVWKTCDKHAWKVV